MLVSDIQLDGLAIGLTTQWDCNNDPPFAERGGAGFNILIIWQYWPINGGLHRQNHAPSAEGKALSPFRFYGRGTSR